MERRESAAIFLSNDFRKARDEIELGILCGAAEITLRDEATPAEITAIIVRAKEIAAQPLPHEWSAVEDAAERAQINELKSDYDAGNRTIECALRELLRARIMRLNRGFPIARHPRASYAESTIEELFGDLSAVEAIRAVEQRIWSRPEKLPTHRAAGYKTFDETLLAHLQRGQENITDK